MVTDRRARARTMTYEERLARYEQMKALHDEGKGSTFEKLGELFEMSPERARQIVSGPAPRPTGVNRLAGTKRRRVLEARIATWQKRLDDGVGSPETNRSKIAQYQAELDRLEN